MLSRQKRARNNLRRFRSAHRSSLRRRSANLHSFSTKVVLSDIHYFAPTSRRGRRGRPRIVSTVCASRDRCRLPRKHARIRLETRQRHILLLASATRATRPAARLPTASQDERAFRNPARRSRDTDTVGRREREMSSGPTRPEGKARPVSSISRGTPSRTAATAS